MKRHTILTLLLSSLLLLSACGQDGYEEGYGAGQEAGYSQGYAAGYDAALEESQPPEAAQPEAPASQLPEGFVLVSDYIPDVILEIRYYSTYNFVGEPIDGYQAPVAILTEEAARALKQVSDEMVAQGYRLKIYDAYRPTRAVAHFAAWAQDPEDHRMQPYFYPELDKSVLFARGYIASRSGHSRGSTVDLTLFHMATGKEVDMGGPFDYFGSRSHVNYSGLTQEQAANRMLLRKAMEAHGFRGIANEWWHFVLNNEPYPDQYFDFPVSTTAKDLSQAG